MDIVIRGMEPIFDKLTRVLCPHMEQFDVMYLMPHKDVLIYVTYCFMNDEYAYRLMNTEGWSMDEDNEAMTFYAETEDEMIKAINEMLHEGLKDEKYCLHFKEER